MYLSQVFEFRGGHASGLQTSLMSLGKLCTVTMSAIQPYICLQRLCSFDSSDMPPEVVPVSPWEVVGISKTLELERWRFDSAEA